MNTVHEIEEIQSFVAEEKKLGKKIGFVPTMGALHEGHISLVHAAKHQGLSCIMSIFVNPTQFGPNEDFSKYPRTLDMDKNMALVGGVNQLFVPSASTIYPDEKNISFIDPPEHLTQTLCGPFRPGHFRGVCTVVNRLLEIVQPDELFLGQKDAQQLRVLQETMKPMHPNVTITGVATVREKSGLALSSRNKYLTEDQKNKSANIYKALLTAQQAFHLGEKNAESLLSIAAQILKKEDPEFKIQYLELVQWNDFQKTDVVEEKSILAIAGFMGVTRLIDNVILEQ